MEQKSRRRRSKQNGWMNIKGRVDKREMENNVAYGERCVEEEEEE